MNPKLLQYILIIVAILSIISIWLFPMILERYVSRNKNNIHPNEINKLNNLEHLTYSQFINKLDAGEISEVIIKTNGIVNEIISLDVLNKRYVTEIIANSINDLLIKFQEHNVHINIENVPLHNIEKHSFLKQIFFSILPVVILIFFISSGRSMQSGLINKDINKAINVQTKFTDVIALEAEKKEIEEIIDFLRNPQKYTSMGASIPKGALLIGPPGNGKTLLARAVAGEAGVPFIYASGSEFVDTFVGVGAGKIRHLFEQASQYKACIIFIDEIDTIGGKRGSKFSHSEYEHTLNQLLTEMDGFKENAGIIVIGATNRSEVLDPALLRRFTRHVYVPNPDVHSRRLILQHYINKIKIDPNINVKELANLTTGLSSSALKTLINDAALLATRYDKIHVTMNEIKEAIDRISIGLERKNLIMKPEEKILTAYHEAGHAIVAAYTKHAIPVHKITITPRGGALGYVQQLPEERVSQTIAELKAKLNVLMGGIAAEIIKNGEENVTTGPSSDIEVATKIARYIVEHGFHNKLGPIKYSDIELLSESYKNELMIETQKLLVEAKENAIKIIKDHHSDWNKVAKALLEQETLTADEFHALLTKQPYYLNK